MQGVNVVKYLIIISMLFSTSAFADVVKTYNKPHRITQLHDELVTAGINPRFVESELGQVDDDIKLTLSDGVNESLVDSVVASHSPKTDEQVAADKLTFIRNRVKDSIDQNDEDSVVRDKAIAWIIYQSIMETRTKVNALISEQGSSVTPLPNRTWAQLKNAVKNEIENQNAS